MNHTKSLNTNKLIEHCNPMLSPDFEFPVYEAEEEEDEGILEKISLLLEYKKNIIQPHEEALEVINLGTTVFLIKSQIEILARQ